MVVLVDLVEEVGLQVGELEGVRLGCVLLELFIPVFYLVLLGVVVELAQPFSILLLQLSAFLGAQFWQDLELFLLHRLPIALHICKNLVYFMSLVLSA